MYQEEYKRWLAADLEDADLKPELTKIACAGVIPSHMTNPRYANAFPRMRGGDPNVAEGAVPMIFFSPHARG